MPPRSDTPNFTKRPDGGTPVVLYDGHCQFCTLQAHKLDRMARGRVTLRSFQDQGVLEAFPGITHEACMVEMKLVAGSGRVYGGSEAVIRSIDMGHVFLGKLLFVYYVPIVRQIADLTYRWVARNRYRFVKSPDDCETGSCSRHAH